METRSLPRFPFNGWPVQWFHPSVGFAWFVEPGVLISQVSVARLTVESANVMQDSVDDPLDVEHEHLQELGGLSVIHDWRAVESYEPHARRIFVERMRRRPKGYLKRAIVCVRMNPFLRLAIESANLLAAVTLGGRVTIVDDPEPAMRRLGVRVPARDSLFPSR